MKRDRIGYVDARLPTRQALQVLKVLSVVRRPLNLGVLHLSPQFSDFKPYINSPNCISTSTARYTEVAIISRILQIVF